MQRDEVLSLYRRHVNRSLAALAQLLGSPLEVSSAGAWVYDEHGTGYLDCGGYAVFLLGHRHPRIVSAVRRQLDTHPLATRLLPSPPLADAAATLAGVAPPGLDHVFLTNSGAEATELALKLARLGGCTRVVAALGGFHGKTLGALSVTGRVQYRAPFAPLLPDVEFVPFGDVAALEAALATDGRRTAVLLEPVQGEAGVVLPPPGYLRAVRAACTAHGALLLVDEVQTGLGRLGRWWGVDAEQVRPDVVLAGKVLSGGVVPVGAVLATGEVFAPLDADPLLHSSTYAGNPLAAVAAAETVRTIADEGLVDRAAELGRTLLAATHEILAAGCPGLVREVRGEGLLIGIDCVTPDLAAELMMALLQHRVITSYSLNTHTVLRLTPPAVLEPGDVARLQEALTAAARDLARSHRAAA
ncbi:aspartate aminotransferase family protein [Geodermatophilus sp. SYSU D00742]